MAKLDGRLTESRRALKGCALEACPTAVQRDCVRWLDELTEQIPTIVFEAITDSGAAQRVRVAHGERVLLEVLDGRPIELDPGYYEFRFELGDHEPEIVSVLLKQGEKNRLVSADFRRSVPDELVNVPAQAPASQPVSRVREQHQAAADGPLPRPVPVALYASAGVAIAAAATATAFGINTRLLENEAYDECAPGCSEERIDGIQRSALITDIALAVAAASSLASLVLYWQRRSDGEARSRRLPSVRPSLSWHPAGAAAGVEGSF